MQFISVFLDIAKLAWFRKNAGVSRTQEVCNVICIFFGSVSSLWCNCVKFHHDRICITNFREGPIHTWAAPKRPILNRVNNVYKPNHLKHAQSEKTPSKKIQISTKIMNTEVFSFLKNQYLLEVLMMSINFEKQIVVCDVSI